LFHPSKRSRRWRVKVSNAIERQILDRGEGRSRSGIYVNKTI
jgi:hypothetical protein